MTISSQA